MSSRIPITLAIALLGGCLAVFATSLRPSGDGRDVATVEGGTSGAAVAEPLPAASGETVLRVTGVARGNAGPRITKVDFATLDRLARERVTVHEPFLKRDVTFSGVPMGELLDRAGVAPSARRLYLHALDDYHVELPIAGVVADGFLATRADGKPIEIAEGGPVRLVFASDGGLGANTDNWIWSIDSMRARR